MGGGNVPYCLQLKLIFRHVIVEQCRNEHGMLHTYSIISIFTLMKKNNKIMYSKMEISCRCFTVI